MKSENALALVLPHQLFEANPALVQVEKVVLVEEYLLFQHYAFHKQKLAFHRASMNFYASWLKNRHYRVEYVESLSEKSDIRTLVPELKSQGWERIHYIDPVDDWLHQRMKVSADQAGMELISYESPLFMNSSADINDYLEKSKSFRQTDFYIRQRKLRNILIDADNKPVGGRWTFDTANRKKYPKGHTPPSIDFPPLNRFYSDAWTYVERNFPDNVGQLNKSVRYPVTYKETRQWLDVFLQERLAGFGTYQDAMVKGEHFLHHSILSPMLNAGLITPAEVIERTLAHAGQREVPLNALEGFIRQILGWREFIRIIYEKQGRRQRSKNYWGFTRPLPPSFWEGQTGILPVDQVIQKVLATGYAHHIERLMVLGNFMLLCEFNPDEVYRWFMEMFIDACDWVMVPNVYGMSQFADGGIMSSKPYISSSNYLMKMGDFAPGPWQQTWDGLFWRFMNTHRQVLKKNPRMRMLISTFDKMAPQKQQSLLEAAEQWLCSIS